MQQTATEWTGLVRCLEVDTLAVSLATVDESCSWDWKQEARPGCGYPAVVIESKPAAGDDAVHVYVLGEGLTPGVEHHGDTELGIEVTAGEFLQSACRDVGCALRKLWP